MQNREPLEPLEAVVANVIAQHPEYHGVLSEPERALVRDFGTDTGGVNPFLHMGLHIALLEQLQTERPSGIHHIHTRLAREHPHDPHAVEHQMMACLAAALQQAERTNTLPDEAAYLADLKRLI